MILYVFSGSHFALFSILSDSDSFPSAGCSSSCGSLKRRILLTSLDILRELSSRWAILVDPTGRHPAHIVLVEMITLPLGELRVRFDEFMVVAVTPFIDVMDCGV